MPRPGAKGKWDLKKTPEEWYYNKDPWKVVTRLADIPEEFDRTEEERNKAYLICGLIEPAVMTGVDIGCGEGYFDYFLYSRKVPRFWGIDISHIAIGRATEHGAQYYPGDESFLQFSYHDITEPFQASEEIHLAIMSEVLYYIKPDMWSKVSDNISDIIVSGGQFIISVGQYFTEEDIRKIFPWCEFDKVFKLPSEKYEYNLIMSGRKK